MIGSSACGWWANDIIAAGVAGRSSLVPLREQRYAAAHQDNNQAQCQGVKETFFNWFFVHMPFLYNY